MYHIYVQWDFVSESELMFTFAMSSPVCICNVRAPYSGDWNFRQFFYTICYLSHSLTSSENFIEIVPGEPLRRERGLNARGVAKYNDFGPIEGYISETVQDRRYVTINDY